MAVQAKKSRNQTKFKGRRTDHYQRYHPELEDHDIAQVLTRFETPEEILAENRERIRLLRKSEEVIHLELAEKLSACDVDNRCNSPACRACTSQYRKYIVGEMLRTYEGEEKLMMVTVVPFSDAFSTHELMQFDPQVLMKRVRRQLKETGLGDLIMMGGVELDLDINIGMWQPHLHFICPDVGKHKNWEKFKRKFYKETRHQGNREGKQIPVRKEVVTDKPEAFSYCVKMYWSMIKSYKSSDGKMRYQDRRLDPYCHNLSMIKLDSLKMGDLSFLQGVRRRGKHIL